MNKIAILGAGGHGKVAADVALLNGWDEVEYFDDSFQQDTKSLSSFVSGSTEDLLSRYADFHSVFVAIGDNSIRTQKLELFFSCGANVATLIHPSVLIGSDVTIGAGSIAMPGVIINANTAVGYGVILNTACSVDHDCSVANGAHLGPGVRVAGGTEIGVEGFLGVGAVTVPRVIIGSRAIVGAGSVVTSNVGSGTTVVGVPARCIRKN